MILKDRYLIVIAIIEGKDFPQLAGHQCIVEGVFDKEVLVTDPVPIGQPGRAKIEQELAWELDRNGLHNHKIKRTAVKLRIYLVNSKSPSKEQLGYIVFDIRSISTKKASKWYPILNASSSLAVLKSGSAHAQPHLLCTVYLDNDGHELQPSRSGLFSNVPDSMIQPVLKHTNTQQHQQSDDVRAPATSYYQIGPTPTSSSACKDTASPEDVEAGLGESTHAGLDWFILSISLLQTGNIAPLIPTTSSASTAAGAAAFHFEFDMLGHRLSGADFSDFVVTRLDQTDSFRCVLFSQLELLRVYFDRLDQGGGTIPIDLVASAVAGPVRLATSHLPIGQLLARADPALHVPAVYEDLLPLCTATTPTAAANANSGNSKRGIARAAASATATVELQRKIGDAANANDPYLAVAVVLRRFNAQMPPLSTQMVKRLGWSGNEAMSIHSSSQDIANSKMNGTITPATTLLPFAAAHPKSQLAPSIAVPTSIEQNTSINSFNNAGAESLEKFCFSIELFSITLNKDCVGGGVSSENDNTAASSLFYAKYVYAAFGTSQPIMTYPPAAPAASYAQQSRKKTGDDNEDDELSTGNDNQETEIMLPQGLCIFELAADRQDLVDQLECEPLWVEIVERRRRKLRPTNSKKSKTTQKPDQQSSNMVGGDEDVTLGWARVNLGAAVDQSPNRKTGSARIVAVTSGQFLGRLNYSLQLEEFLGAATTDRPGNHSYHATVQHEDGAPSDHHSKNQHEFHAALELELWKQAEEHEFQTRLAAKEKKLMASLSDEWRRRERERETLTRKRLVEYDRLETELRNQLEQLRTREEELVADEAELVRLRKDAQGDQKRVRQEATEQTKRAEERGQHEVQLVTNQLEHWKRMSKEWQTKCTNAEKQLTTLRESINQNQANGLGGTAAEARLQLELAHANEERNKLERKLDATLQSKDQYKKSYTKALQALARLEQQRNDQAKTQLKRKETELEHMRLRYLAREEAALGSATGVGGGNASEPGGTLSELQTIRKDLDKLKENVTLSPNSYESTAALDEAEAEHIRRLIEERDSLMRTGVYTCKDAVIQQLDAEIQSLLDKKQQQHQQQISSALPSGTPRSMD